MRERQAFHLNTGSQPGISQSSYSTLGDLLPGRELGQAKMATFVNASTGNVFVAGPSRQIDAPGFRFRFFVP